MLGLLTPGNRESARCRRCRPAPGAPAAVPRRAGVLCRVRVKKAPFVRQGRPVTNERLQPPRSGRNWNGRNAGMGQKSLSWCWGAAGGTSSVEGWPSYGVSAPRTPKPFRFGQRLQIWLQVMVRSRVQPSKLPGMKAELLCLPAEPAARAGCAPKDAEGPCGARGCCGSILMVTA